MIERVAAFARSAAQYAMPRTAFRLSLMRGSHDEAELDLLPFLVDSSREAIDVGANVGRYASRLARLSRHVHVFEPHPRLARMLKFSLPANCTVYQAAVSESTDDLELNIPIVSGRQDEGLAFIGHRQLPERCIELTVKAVPLDKLADRPIGFIKIDVEGHEQSVLRGSLKLLCSHRPVILIEAEERHSPNAVKEVFAFFSAQSYAGYFLLGGRLHDIVDFTSDLQDTTRLSKASECRRDAPYINNFIFVPEERGRLAI